MAAVITAEEFEELYRATAADVFAYVRRRTTGDAEDLVAEVFATAWRRRADLPPALLQRAWLFGTARKLLLADGRRSARDATAVSELARQGPATGPSAGTAEAVVTAALARLTPAQRELIQLTEWERLTAAELAITLGVRPGTARVRLHRARQALAADPEMRALVEASRSNQHVDTSPGVLRAGIAGG